MRKLTKREVKIARKINKLRDGLMGTQITKSQESTILDSISTLNIELRNIARN